MLLHKDDNNIRFAPALLSSLFFAMLFASSAWAGNFRVSPVSLEFDSEKKSGVIRLINEGEESLRLQLGAAEWKQDEEGKDRYSETSDVVFFPKIMVVEPGSERVIRVGRKLSPAEIEKTYRLFVEEIPRRTESEGVRVNIAVRFGVPLFVKPLEEEPRGEVASAGLSKGRLDILVKNNGNVRFMIKKINISGGNPDEEVLFTRQLSGWYLLSGASRLYETSIPPEVCAGLATLDIEVETDRMNFTRKVDVHKEGCLQ